MVLSALHNPGAVGGYTRFVGMATQSLAGRPAWIAAVLTAIGLLSIAPTAAPAPQQGLDPMLAAYTTGDHGVVTRTLVSSNDFRKLRLVDGRRFERWLGPWSNVKADFLLELIDRAAAVAPAYVVTLVTKGQAYVVRRPSAVGSSAQDDAAERRWHVIAAGVLQQRLMGAQIVGYVDVLQRHRPLPASAAVWDPRLNLARGIGQEQVCRMLHATARNDRLLSEFEGKAATPPAMRQMAIECMQTAQRLLENAAARDEVREEARTRAGFAAFQLGKNNEARASLTAGGVSADRHLAYWRALFLGRLSDALGADADAERAYREAVQLFPDAQTARIGLALALFRLHRDDAADEAVRAARRVSADGVDPWETYFEGDGRFVEGWLAAVRKARQ
jgi:tetratricopeptide (TPR) repeat protein